jgi:hypothetical protein
VRNHNGGSAFHRTVQRLLNNFLALLIQCTCCFVQNHNLGVLYQRSGNSNSLLLPSRKFTSLETAKLVKTRVQFVLHFLHFDRINIALELVVIILLHSLAV